MLRQPWIIYRYVGRELLVVFTMSLAALSVLFMIVLGIQAVQAGFKLGVVVEWILRSLVYSFYYTVPVSLLIASSLVFGRVAADREYTALCASGISPLRLFAPMLLLSAAVFFVAMTTQGTLLPLAHYNQRNIARYLIKQLEHLGSGKQGRLQIENGSVYWDEHAGPNLRGVLIEMNVEVDRGSDGFDGSLATGSKPGVTGTEQLLVSVTAETAQVSVDRSDGNETVRLNLDNVGILASNKASGILFEEKEWTQFLHNIQAGWRQLEFPLRESRRREGDKTTAELRADIATFTAERAGLQQKLTESPSDEVREANMAQIGVRTKRIRKSEAEIWERRALAFSCLSFAFLGFPLSLSLRYRHRLVSFFASGMLVVTIFYPALLLGRTLAESGTVPAPIGLLGGNVVLITIGLIATGRQLFR
ncbi:MAG: LptF/LptG family permease [Planctomycetota bacterium]